MSTLPPIPIVDGEALSAEDQRVIALFDKLEEGQLDFLDQASKRVIELSTGMLAVLFGVIAFGNDFPPPYLVNNLLAKALIFLTLLGYIAALLAGVIAVQPKAYARSHHGLTRLRQELEKMLAYKTRWFRIGTALFFVASLLLMSLLVAIIWPA